MIQGKRFLSVRETARATGLGEAYIRRGLKQGTIPHLMTGKKVLVNVPMLVQRLEEQCRTAGGGA